MSALGGAAAATPSPGSSTGKFKRSSGLFSDLAKGEAGAVSSYEVRQRVPSLPPSLPAHPSLCPLFPSAGAAPVAAGGPRWRRIPQVLSMETDRLFLGGGMQGADGTGAKHSVSQEEQTYYAKFINTQMEADEAVAGQYGLPMDPSGDELYATIRDGVILCKLLNLAVEDSTDERALNIPKDGEELKPWKMHENLDLVLNSAKAIGCKIVNIGTGDIIEGVKHNILGLLWQIVRVSVLYKVSIKQIPELVVLLEEDEELSEFLALPPEKILLRWVNHHLKESKRWTRDPVKNFSGDIVDSEAYLLLLNRLDEKCSTDALKSDDHLERARTVISNSEKIGFSPFLSPESITGGNSRLNLAFVANLFATRHGLEIPQEKIVEMAGLLEDEGESREERCFVMWLNSLNLDEHVHSLTEDLSDGVVLLQAIESLKPGTVQKKRVNKRPIKMTFKRGENCNYFMELAKELGLPLHGIGSVDLLEKNKKLVESLLWQLMRYHTGTILESLTKDGKKPTDKDILQWAVQKLEDAGVTRKLSSFKDSSLSDGLVLLDLLKAIEPEVIDTQYIFDPPKDDKEKEMNARYVISVARKLGATIFLTWEDIVEVNQKMLVILAASLMALGSS